MASTLVTPLLISEPFGAGASNPTYINLPIPVPSQIGTTVNAASFTDGFPPSTMTPEASGGLPFFGQDMNGILYMITAYCANFAAGALSSYNSTLSSDISGYPPGVVLVNAAGTGLWINQTSGNTSDPDTGGAGWLPVATTGEYVLTATSGTYTLTAAQAAHPIIAITGTLTGNIIVNFPANQGQSWIVAAYTTGAYTITLQTAAAGNTVPLTSGSGYSNAQNVFSDGTNLYSNNISTAGLAPLASPALTGTPTAPTASSSSNTTQIATTAMVQSAITAALSIYAKLASPIFSGTPTVPTAALGTNTLQAASTAFVQAAIAHSATNPLVKAGVTPTASQGANSFSFPTAFATACLAVVIGNETSTATYAITGFSKTGFTWNSGAGVPFTYIAVGY